MTRWIWGVWTAMALALAGCASMPRPVPLIGSPSDIARLEGQWSGEYHSGETRRSGSITFALSAGADTAFGDVTMLPRQLGHGRLADETGPGAPAAPRTLPIRFVMTAGDSLMGVLEPYEDPECGCLLVTRFEGRLRGDAIEGSYASVNTRTREVTRGEWKVTRHRPPVSGTSSGLSR